MLNLLQIVLLKPMLLVKIYSMIQIKKVLQELRNLQEVLQEVEVEVVLPREEQKPTGEAQEEGAILGVSLISQCLQT